ncbi:transcriptional regulator [Sphingomonas sp.]|uniref:transcriptional regulator n=1 Tax=Sphingomonas sp. TaxID=28214 RepID=UPI002FD92520
MLVFLDFEASSLGKRSYPIEVAWVFEDGRFEEHLIRPAPDWEDWDPAAEAIHHIARATLLEQGAPHDAVARRMIDQLAGHALLASAPSWDGKWLSTLLRAAGLPRHSLRLGNSHDAQRQAARAALADRVPAAQLDATVEELVVHVEMGSRAQPAHRALADAREERDRWLAVRDAAAARAAGR